MATGDGCCCFAIFSSKKKVPIDPPIHHDHDSLDEDSPVPGESQEPADDVVLLRPEEEVVEQVKKKNKLRVFIVFYSMYGHVEILARRVKLGVDSVDGVEGVLFRVSETLPSDVLEQMRVPVKYDDDVPLAAAENLVEADGLLFGFPTRFGSMAAQMQAFFESMSCLWPDQKLAGKPAGLFVSTGTQGGGQETTAWTAVTQLTHHGMIYVPIGYTFGSGMFGMDLIRGGSPYGAGVFSGDGTREPSETELVLAEHQGKYMASIIKRFGPVLPS